MKSRSVEFAATMPTPVLAPITGIVWKILVDVGESVTRGQPVMLIESMKMEVPVCAPCGGIIQTIAVRTGDSVEDGDTIATLTESW